MIVRGYSLDIFAPPKSFQLPLTFDKENFQVEKSKSALLNQNTLAILLADFFLIEKEAFCEALTR